jgi:hypothetical protein
LRGLDRLSAVPPSQQARRTTDNRSPLCGRARATTGRASQVTAREIEVAGRCAGAAPVIPGSLDKLLGNYIAGRTTR